jgi:hypothetical protein
VVVFWSGALAWSPADVAWLPAAGRLVAASWLAVRGPVASPFPAEEPGATPVPGPTEEPIPTPSPTPSPAPTAGGDATPGSDATPGDEATPTPSPLPGTQPLPLPDEIAAAGIADWEVRFDPAGRRLGVWVADPAQPGAGRLSLVTIADDGQLGGVLVDGTAALPGFSIGADRLAWATPPGQNGQGSLVVVFAWNGDATGQLQSLPEPGDEPVVVAR